MLSHAIPGPSRDHFPENTSQMQSIDTAQPMRPRSLFRNLAACSMLLLSSCIVPASIGEHSQSTVQHTETTAVDDDTPYAKLDQLRRRFYNLDWQAREESQALATEFAAVRATPGWKAFVQALKVCDDSANTLLDEDILDWSNPGPKIDSITRARNAWRHAVTYGIKPPKLSIGWTTFAESDLTFRLNVENKSEGVLIVRSQRGQVLGIFDLRLDDDGKQHVVAHMLERALRFPDLYLSYPWDILMATDTIYVPDVRVYVDRLKKTAKVVDTGSGETETKK
jgi:hypothetical protein